LQGYEIVLDVHRVDLETAGDASADSSNRNTLQGTDFLRNQRYEPLQGGFGISQCPKRDDRQGQQDAGNQQ
jgi:hypothetical protein